MKKEEASNNTDISGMLLEHRRLQTTHRDFMTYTRASFSGKDFASSLFEATKTAFSNAGLAAKIAAVVGTVLMGSAMATPVLAPIGIALGVAFAGVTAYKSWEKFKNEKKAIEANEASLQALQKNVCDILKDPEKANSPQLDELLKSLPGENRDDKLKVLFDVKPNESLQEKISDFDKKYDENGPLQSASKMPNTTPTHSSNFKKGIKSLISGAGSAGLVTTIALLAGVAVSATGIGAIVVAAAVIAAVGGIAVSAYMQTRNEARENAFKAQVGNLDKGLSDLNEGAKNVLGVEKTLSNAPTSEQSQESTVQKESNKTTETSRSLGGIIAENGFIGLAIAGTVIALGVAFGVATAGIGPALLLAGAGVAAVGVVIAKTIVDNRSLNASTEDKPIAPENDPDPQLHSSTQEQTDSNMDKKVFRNYASVMAELGQTTSAEVLEARASIMGEESVLQDSAQEQAAPIVKAMETNEVLQDEVSSMRLGGS